MKGNIFLNMNNNVIKDKTKRFALDIINAYKLLTEEKKEFVISKQIMRSGTSIGANVREAQRGQSVPDFYSKMNIALKEAEETLYWLELLEESGILEQEKCNTLKTKCDELIRLLVSITKNQKDIY